MLQNPYCSWIDAFPLFGDRWLISSLSGYYLDPSAALLYLRHWRCLNPFMPFYYIRHIVNWFKKCIYLCRLWKHRGLSPRHSTNRTTQLSQWPASFRPKLHIFARNFSAVLLDHLSQWVLKFWCILSSSMAPPIAFGLSYVTRIATIVDFGEHNI